MGCALLFFVLTGASTRAQSTATVTLAWDSSVSTNVAGYRVYYGEESSWFQYSQNAGPLTTTTIRNLEGGLTYFFTVVAYTITGVESDPSEEVYYLAPGGLPPNLPPTLDPIPNLTLPVDAPPTAIRLTGITPGASDEDQALTFSAVSSNPDVVSNLRVDFSPYVDSGTLTLTTAPGANGVATITVTVDDGAARSNRVSRSFHVTVGTPVRTNLLVEAESGSVSGPLARGVDSGASGGRYVYSTVDNSGSVNCRVNIPQADEYVVWCRVLSTDAGSDSFYVSVDGTTEDVYDTAINSWGSNWQWTLLNGRTTGNPRRLSFSRGWHTLTFRSREADTRLDAVYVTNDPSFVPVEILAKPVVSPVPGLEVSFNSPAGYRYNVQASDDLRTWTTLWRTSVASTNQHFAYVDSSTRPGARRFYRLLVQ